MLGQKNSLLGLCLLFIGIGPCRSQYRPPTAPVTEEDTVGYRFLNQDLNAIENVEYLRPFFEKLYHQRVKGGKKLQVVHIGDSHVLGDYFTREVRRRLQREFGNAGRGLVFPYKLAASNGPRDFMVEAAGRWQGSNCQRDLSPVTRYGISGFLVQTTTPNGALHFRLRDSTTSEVQLFTKVTVFHRKTADDFDFQILDEQTRQEAQLLIEGSQYRSYYFDRPVSQFTLSALPAQEGQRKLEIDGVIVENELSGLIYHTIGVNGAKFSDFARSELFVRQLSELSPDLVVLSFGTNEAQGKMPTEYLYQQIDLLVTQILDASPASLILLTTPADSYLRGKGFNPNLPIVRHAIVRYAREKGYALWDLYAIGGGEKSAESWKKSGLMASDSVHFSKIGYAVQGKLFYQSLIQAYNGFAELREQNAK
ncbi:MAG: GDSL-type esterase/lipase family protein [Saprospiraceae bacterium]